ncbi:restriction endonuclease subunit S [Reyranella sp.]|uniref:restriction endonuclease subunit S n=1 Tax=Reyranella sp. TaxID=1929291 RepID=UPI004035FEC4
MSDVPLGWAETSIGDICHLVNGRAFKPSDWEEVGLPIIRIQNLNRPDAKFNFYSKEVDARFLVESGDLLFAWSGTPGTSFGAHVWQGSKAILNQHIFNVHFDRAYFDRDFLRHAINQTLDEQIAKAHGGVGLRHVTKGKFEETVISIPPLAEQRRIVAKINSLSSKSKRAREHLDHIPRLVEKYKQAVLAAVFNAPDNRPTPLSNLVSDGPTNGYSPQTSADDTGTLSLRLSATTRGVLDLSAKAVKRLSETIPVGSRYWLQPGDLLIQRANSLEHLGAAAIFDGPPATYIYLDLMMRVRIADPEVRRLVWRFLNSRQGRSYFVSKATGTAGNMPKINGAVVRGMLIPMPSAARVSDINRSVDHAFAWINRLAAEATSARTLIDRLDQAVLAKAFRGELVPQDPNDEPASVLLERIRAERETAPAAKPRRGRVRRS